MFMVSGWELGEYLSAFIVVIAVCGEFVGEFTDWFTAGDEAKKRRLRKLSTLVLVAALAVELLCLVRTSQTLHEQIAPRSITRAGAAAIESACRRFSVSKIVVRSYAMDIEGWRLAQMLKNALEAGGLRPKDDTANLIELRGFVVGVQVNGPDSEKEFMGALKSAIAYSGLVLSDQPSGTPRPDGKDTVEVLVGVRPFVASE